ncbi:hypothetical protein KR038_001009 [Drosophila bunnanda]|nr:hypothetical protein KR038_001009 [Drosophila bunnanda]
MFEFATKVGPMAITLMMLLLVLSPVDSRWTRRPRRTTTPRSTTEKADRHQYVHHWPPLVAPPATIPAPVPALVPAPVSSPVPAPIPAALPPQDVWKPSPSPRLIDSFDRRSADGEYEFRFQLDNGNTRYERAYWLPVGKDLVLAKKGFYSVPLPNDQYSTIFYTADNRGYHVDMQTLSGERPLLPRSLDVPGVATKMDLGTGPSGGAGTKRNSISDPERNEQDVENVEDAVDGDVDTSVAGTERVPNAVSQVETETETETEPSTLANDILATEAADDDDDDDVDVDVDVDGAAPDDVDDEGDSN